MSTFASAEWVEALDRAARDVDPDPSAADLEGFVLQQVVTGPDGDDAAWTVAVRDGRVRFTVGRADADVTLTTDRATAEAVASGAESAQAAFMAGRLRIGGDPTALVRVQALFAEVGRVRPAHGSGAQS